MSDGGANGSGPSGAGGSETARAERVMADAERVMEDVGEQVGSWASQAVARAREEIEDIWAEAQSLRRGS